MELDRPFYKQAAERLSSTPAPERKQGLEHIPLLRVILERVLENIPQSEDLTERQLSVWENVFDQLVSNPPISETGFFALQDRLDGAGFNTDPPGFKELTDVLMPNSP